MMMMVLCLFAFAATFTVMARKGRAVTKKVDEKVYLQHADELSYDIYGSHPDAQFLRGNVSFLHKGMHLTCDSAYFYESTNSFQAYGNVRMRQGDTLTMAGDRAYYDGNDEIGHAYGNVVLTHRKSKLYCDTLDYDKMYGIADAYGSAGIKLVEGKDVLTADWGRYFTSTRHSEFYYNVVLTNDKGLRIETDTLHYANNTSLAHVLGPSTIVSEGSTVQTDDSYYNTRTETSQLYGRSTLYNGGRIITADTLTHNDKTGINEGRGQVIYNDTVNKNILLSNYFTYNDKTGYGYATDSIVVIDYSQKDSLWMHCDTIRIRTLYINTDSVQREVYCYNHVRAYRRDLQAVCDSMVILSRDSCATMYKDPVIWNNGNQLLGEKINIFTNDSTVRYAEVLGQALSVEQLIDSVHYNQVASRDMMAYFKNGKLRENWALGNVQIVYYPMDDSDSTLIGLNYTETDTLKMYISDERKLERLWMSASTGTLYPMTQTPPEKHHLPSFAWFDYMRPVSKDDIFIWRPKTRGTELKLQKRREAPKRKI
jgi:lipopolysaccharide export system protein LptA